MLSLFAGHHRGAPLADGREGGGEEGLRVCAMGNVHGQCSHLVVFRLPGEGCGGRARHASGARGALSSRAPAGLPITSLVRGTRLSSNFIS